LPVFFAGHGSPENEICKEHMPTRVLKYIWAMPATLLGAVLACMGALAGAQWRWHSGVVEVTLSPPGAPATKWARRLPFSAITFGHVVLAITDKEHADLRRHERVHVAQYERWGAFFLLAYPAESLLQLLNGRRPYLDNRFEVAAREGASHGAPSSSRSS
jgi:hypothetical protein